MDYAAPPSVLMDIPSGIDGTRRTLQLMNALVMSGKVAPLVRQAAVAHAAKLQSRDFIGTAAQLQDFVKSTIRYVRDIRNVETLQTADYTLRYKVGDCDDQSVLLASLLESVGLPTRFVAVSFKPNLYSHVYTQVKPNANGPWLGVETILNKPLGWEPPGVVDMLIMEN